MTTATRLRLIGPAPVAGALRAGAAVVDGRAPQAFDVGHLPGAVNVPAGPGAGELAALVLSPDVPVLALAARADHAVELEAELEAAGFRALLGAVAGEHPGRAVGGHQLTRGGAIEVERLADELATGAVLLIDVREAAEWRRGYVPGSVHLPLGELREAAHLLPDVPTVTCCSDGRRAAVAASALRRWGHRNVWRVADGGVADLLGRPIGLDLLGAA
ncbi:MAG TPA: rhodanese-like domain-containing protein [Gaiellales bacterium]|nr:rhodanese-like domain-containing protein [Gaiellales bacterium]